MYVGYSRTIGHTARCWVRVCTCIPMHVRTYICVCIFHLSVPQPIRTILRVYVHTTYYVCTYMHINTYCVHSVCILMYVHMFVHTYIRTYIRTYCIHTCTYVCMYKHNYINMYVCMYVRTYLRMCMWMLGGL